MTHHIPDHCLTWLSADERARSKRQSPGRRQQYVRGRVLLRAALSSLHPGRTPRSWIVPAEGPLIVNEDCQLVASISHSGRYLCCAVARGDLMLGIDLEEAIPRRDVQGIADNWFGREEAAYMADRSKGEAERIFYSLWTAKEAYLKALGVGIGGGLRSLQASFDAQGIASYHLQKPDQLRWRLFAYGHSEWHLAVTVGSDNERYLPVQIDWHSGAGLLGGEGADDGLPSALGQPALYRL